MQQAKACRMQLTQATGQQKNDMLLAMADALVASQDAILAANAQDLAAAKGQISDVMLDRLALDASRITAMATGMRQVAALPDPVGKTLRHVERPNGLQIDRVSVPLGVVAIIYESRPNVTSDAAALALKSGNACILRSGKEAFRSADAIVRALQDGLDRIGMPRQLVQLVQDTSRASATELMTGVGYIDLLIPRGGKGLIASCVANAKVPRFFRCALLAAVGEDIEIVGLFHLGQMLDQGDQLCAGRSQLAQVLGGGVSAELGEVDVNVVHLRMV